MSTQETGFASIADDRPPLLPPGRYTLKYVGHETKLIFKRPKLYVWFEVMDLGEYFQVRIPRYYGIRHPIPQRKYGKNGRFAVGWKSDFLNEYSRLFGEPHRPDRMPMSAFRNVLVYGKVRTVESSHRQQERSVKYSVVDELLGLAEGRIDPFPSPAPSPSPPPPPT